MAEIKPAPRIRCDNCGHTVDMKPHAYDRNKHQKPKGWGGARIDPTVVGTYPNHIAMGDLCPSCLRLVHNAVGEALAEGRKEKEDSND